VDFRNSIIVMTSNIGAELIRKGSTIGFASRSDEVKTQEMDYERMKEKLLGELKKTFRPEFLNRIDNVVVFHALNKEHIRQIVDLMLAVVNQQLAEKEIKLEVTDAAKDFLGEKGYDEVFGARPLRRVIQDMVEDKLSESLLRGQFRAGDTAVVDLEGDEIVIRPSVVEAEIV
jgi:ATP-dependent Clp protease ATP-binding subunit ClpC